MVVVDVGFEHFNKLSFTFIVEIFSVDNYVCDFCGENKKRLKIFLVEILQYAESF